MKRFGVLILAALLVAQSASAEVDKRRASTSTVVKFANVIASTGVVTTGATYTLSCGCAAVGSALAYQANGCCINNGNRASGADAACTGATAAAEIGTTGTFNLTINAGDMAGEECFVLAVAGTVAGSVDHLFKIVSAEYTSFEDITSMTATQPAVKHVGNTTGQGEYISAGNNGDAAYYVSSAGKAFRLYSSSDAFYAESASSGSGIKAVGAAAYAGARFQGGGTEGNGAEFCGDANCPTKTGNAIAMQTTATTPTSTITANGVYIGSTASSVMLVPGTGYYGINCGSAFCFNGAGLISRLVNE